MECNRSGCCPAKLSITGSNFKSYQLLGIRRRQIITFQLEQYDENFKKDVSEIMQRHGEEFTYHKDIKGEVDPNWDLGTMINDMKNLYICTARDDDKLIGYFIFFLTVMAHYKSIPYACEDTFYVLPEYRGTGVGGKFIAWSVDQMKATGVKVLKVTNKFKADYRELWTKLGFEPEEISYTQVLNGN